MCECSRMVSDTLIGRDYVMLDDLWEVSGGLFDLFFLVLFFVFAVICVVCLFVCCLLNEWLTNFRRGSTALW